MPLTTVATFVQLLSGGTFLLKDQEFAHVATGIAVMGVAWFSLYGAIKVRPLDRTLLVLSLATVVLVMAAASFASKDTLFEHYGLAVAAFGASAASAVVALLGNPRRGSGDDLDDIAPR